MPQPPRRGCATALLCTALEVVSDTLVTAPPTKTLGNLMGVCRELRNCVLRLAVWEMRVREALAGNSDYRMTRANRWLSEKSFGLCWSGERALPDFDVSSADSIRTLRMLCSTTCAFCGKCPRPLALPALDREWFQKLEPTKHDASIPQASGLGAQAY
ncbi:hypothetical protein T484DRAFT_1745431 [Baffinella frigidus]|nr:hypothetical protein T484DRAFT_1745431 [Cryptophyta sp. CCMP2293]